MRHPIRFLRRFADDSDGAALIELAFAVPVLTLILLGCFEATRFVLLHQKLDRAATSTADLVAQADGITQAQLDDLFDAAAQAMEPYDVGTNGRILVTSVYRADTDPAEIVWQELSTTGIAVASEIGADGDDATLPDGFTVRTGENVIVAEVFYDYTPFFLSALFEAAQLHHIAYNRPRNSNLTQVD